MGGKMITKTAKKFLKEIEKEKDFYKLVNGLFIVKYLDSEESVYIGEFLKVGDALNPMNTNRVRLNQRNTQRYIKKRMLMTSALGIWKPLSISFEEYPIERILKSDEKEVKNDNN